MTKKLNFVQVEIGLLDEDDRFLYKLTNDEQLLYLKLLMLAGKNRNKIPFNLLYIAQILNFTGSNKELQDMISKIMLIFPKLEMMDSQLGNTCQFLSFKNFANRHNLFMDKVDTADLQKDVIDRDIERDRDIEILVTTIFKSWNETLKHIPIKFLSDNRKRRLISRLKNQLFRESWRELIDKIKASDFACGKNDRQWMLSFDWLIANDHNFLKVLEGKYDNKKSAQLVERPRHLVL